MNCDKSQVVTKLKLWQNSNCDKTQIAMKVKLWHHSNYDKTQIVRIKTHKLKMWQNSNCDKTGELKLWQNSKTKMLTKLKNLNVDKTWNMTNLNLRRRKKTIKGSFSKNILTPWRPTECSLGSVLRFSRCCVNVLWSSGIYFHNHDIDNLNYMIIHVKKTVAA